MNIDRNKINKMNKNIDKNTKKILFTCDYVSNYVFHIFSTGEIGYNSEYSEQNKNFFDKHDFTILKEKKKFLEFGNGKTGYFTPYFLFMPIYLELNSKTIFEKYFELLIKSFNNNNFDEFLSNFTFDWSDPFVLMNFKFLKLKLSNKEWENIIKPYIKDFQILAKIFINYYSRYLKLWDEIKPVISEKINILNKKISDLQKQNSNNSNKNLNSKTLNLIEKWEQITFKKFKYNIYYILLCYANKNGPDANSICYNKNTFYYGSDINYIIDFVSHEIGTHLLVELIYDKLFTHPSEKYDFNLIYAAYENLAMFYNMLIFDKDKLNYALNFDYKSNEFFKIFKKYYKPDITPEFLFNKSIEMIKLNSL